jgi:hypothetical protein
MPGFLIHTFTGSSPNWVVDEQIQVLCRPLNSFSLRVPLPQVVSLSARGWRQPAKPIADDRVRKGNQQ